MRQCHFAAIVFLQALAWVYVTPAKAQWSAQVTGPDVFGNTTVLAAVDSANGDGLVVQCDQNNELDLAYITPGTPSEMDQASKENIAVPVDLLLKVDSGQVIKLSAVLKPWNNTYLGIVASGRTTDIVAAIKAIGEANEQISVGSEIAGEQQSDTFDAANSTSAMNTAEADCKLDSITAAPASGASSSQ